MKYKYKQRVMIIFPEGAKTPEGGIIRTLTGMLIGFHPERAEFIVLLDNALKCSEDDLSVHAMLVEPKFLREIK